MTYQTASVLEKKANETPVRRSRRNSGTLFGIGTLATAVGYDCITTVLGLSLYGVGLGDVTIRNLEDNTLAAKLMEGYGVVPGLLQVPPQKLLLQDFCLELHKMLKRLME